MIGVELEFRGLDHDYGRRAVLHDINLTVEPGEFLAIVGRSGTGKTTLLRLAAGLERANPGQLFQDDQPLVGINRRARLMFQDARLLPWARVADNVALGLPKERLDRVGWALQQVGLADRARDWPTVLSGGQQQRVALARALANEPGLLLLDEPLGALDALTRIDMQALVEQTWAKSGFTSILVTHDVEEAVILADRVVAVDGGRIALEVKVPLPRPRRRDDPRFAPLTEEILNCVLSHSRAT